MKNKCKKTLSGKHSWVGGYVEKGYMAKVHTSYPIPRYERSFMNEFFGSGPVKENDVYEGKEYYVEPRYIDKKCKHCGVVDDTQRDAIILKALKAYEED